MRRPVALLALLLAWLCANGAVLDLLQMVAWGRMFGGYVRSMPVMAAVDRTFDLDKPCKLCMAVHRARDQERKEMPPALTASMDRLVLICQQADPIVSPGPPGHRIEDSVTRARRRHDPVPLPPPKRGTGHYV